MIAKKVITWKDADQSTMYLAGYLLDSLSLLLRQKGGSGILGIYNRADGTLISDGYVSEDEGQGWWTYDPNTSYTEGGGGIFSLNDQTLNKPSLVCWYSMQNLVRIRLREARQSIKKARYGQNKEPKASKQVSRNPNGRKKGSKFGRKKETE
jgi:hypothetical protein